MFRWFTQYVIGGATGKRESAWFAFALWLGFSVWLFWWEASGGSPLPFAQAAWDLLTPFIMFWLAGAHGLDWASRQAGLRKGSPE